MSSGVYCDQIKLSYDEACLRVNTSHPVSIYSQVTECFGCEMLPLGNSSVYQELIVGTVYPTRFLVEAKHSNPWTQTYHFTQHGIYDLIVNKNDTNVECKILTIAPGDDVNKPLWVLLWMALIFLIVFSIVVSVGHARKLLLYVRTHYASRELQQDLGEPMDSGSIRLVNDERGSSPPSPTPLYRHRVKAVDTFRGISIVLMIFVNAGGGKYSMFSHSPWNGLTMADCIFPWFIWIMGFSTVISVKSQIRLERRRKYLFLGAVRRTVTLLALGIVLNSLTTINLNELRLPGVLQRIAITYFIIASLQICFVTQEYVAVGNSCVDKLSDILSCWIQWIVILLLTGIHIYLSIAVPFEHCPPGYLGPGGIVGENANCTGGFASFVDRQVFGPAHMLKRPTPQALYHTIISVDPEGLLGVLTSCLTAFLGVQAGQILLSFYHPKKRFCRWFTWALLTAIIGGVLCNFEQNGVPIPVNKNLWSVSFALITASMAFCIHLTLYLLIDHWMVWNGAPFVHVGRNSIALYFGSCIMSGLFPFSWKPVVDDSTHSEYLYMNTFATILWITIACILARHKVYITV